MSFFRLDVYDLATKKLLELCSSMVMNVVVRQEGIHHVRFR